MIFTGGIRDVDVAANGVVLSAVYWAGEVCGEG